MHIIALLALFLNCSKGGKMKKEKDDSEEKIPDHFYGPRSVLSREARGKAVVFGAISPRVSRLGMGQQKDEMSTRGIWIDLSG